MEKKSNFYSAFTADFHSSVKEDQSTAIVTTHFHDTYELYYLLKGTRVYFTNTASYNLKQNYITLTKPQVLHGTKGEQFSRILIYFHADLLKKHFKDSYINDLLKCFSTDVIPAKAVLAIPEIKKLFFTINTEINNKDYISATTHLASLLLSLNKAVTIYQKTKKQSEDFNASENIKNILQYINDNIENIENISQISDHFHFSKYYFCHFFKKEMNLTVMEYIIYLRIQKAQEMLKTTNKTIDTIAYSLGFKDRSYFCFTFKKRVGIAPSHYRKMHKKKNSTDDLLLDQNMKLPTFKA